MWNGCFVRRLRVITSKKEGKERERERERERDLKAEKKVLSF